MNKLSAEQHVREKIIKDHFKALQEEIGVLVNLLKTKSLPFTNCPRSDPNLNT